MPFFYALCCDDLLPGMDGRGGELLDVLGQYEVAAAEDGDLCRMVGRPQFAQGADAEGGVEDAVREAAGADHLSGCGLESRIVVDTCLELDVEQEIVLLHEGKEFPQRRHLYKAKFLVNAAEVKRLELRERVSADGSLSIAGPVDGLIVADDDFAVAGKLHVELDAVRTHLDGLFKRRHGVLRGVLLIPAAGAAMRPDLCLSQ